MVESEIVYNMTVYIYMCDGEKERGREREAHRYRGTIYGS